jgi:hypothetical protein
MASGWDRTRSNNPIATITNIMSKGFDNPQARFPFTNPTRYCSCGVQSLHHALLLLGKLSDLNRLLANFPIHKNVYFGTELKDLTTAARSCGSRPENLSSSSLRSLRASINRALKAGSPVILGSEPHCHWLVLAGFDGDGGYVWIDSADSDLSGTWDWDEIVYWLKGDEDEEIEEFEAIGIHAGPRDKPNRSMVPHIAGIYELLGGDPDLATEWGAYLEELDTIFDYEAMRGPKVDAETFFANNEEAIVQPVLWVENGELDEKTVREVYANYRTVANFHSLELPAVFETHAVAQMAMMLRDATT